MRALLFLLHAVVTTLKTTGDAVVSHCDIWMFMAQLWRDYCL